MPWVNILNKSLYNVKVFLLLSFSCEKTQGCIHAATSAANKQHYSLFFIVEGRIRQGNFMVLFAFVIPYRLEIFPFWSFRLVRNPSLVFCLFMFIRRIPDALRLRE
jgi:hypothetical protein